MRLFVVPPVLYLVLKGGVYLAKAGLNLAEVATALGLIKPEVLQLPPERGFFYFLGMMILHLVVTMLFFLAAVEVARLAHSLGYGLGVILLLADLLVAEQTIPYGSMISWVMLIWLVIAAPKKVVF